MRAKRTLVLARLLERRAAARLAGANLALTALQLRRREIADRALVARRDLLAPALLNSFHCLSANHALAVAAARSLDVRASEARAESVASEAQAERRAWKQIGRGLERRLLRSRAKMPRAS